jgi:hypothetical protein
LASTTNGRNGMIPTIACGGVLFDGRRGPLLLLLIDLLDELECVLMARTSMTMMPLNLLSHGSVSWRLKTILTDFSTYFLFKTQFSHFCPLFF